MSANPRLTAYLDDHKIRYDVKPHSHSYSSIGTAIAAEVSPRKLAKAVVLEDHQGRHMMAVVPTDNKISIRKLGQSLNREFHLVTERQVYHLFRDCAPGAIPPVGHAFNMETIVDDQLANQRDIYMESGDHETLIHMKQAEFQKLMASSQHGRFSGEVF